MTKAQYKIIIYGVLALAALGVLALLWWLLGRVFAGIGLVLFGAGGRALLKQHQAEEAKAAAKIAAVDKEHQATHQALEEQAADEQQAADVAAAAEQEATARAVDKADSSEDLDAIAAQAAAKAEADKKRWEELLAKPKDSGFVRAGLCAVLALMALLGMAVGHLAHGAPVARGEKARTRALLQALQSCRHMGNKLARTLAKERKQHRAAQTACKKKRKIENTKHTTQKGLILNQKPPLIAPRVLAVGVVLVLVVGGSMLVMGWYLGRQSPAKANP